MNFVTERHDVCSTDTQWVVQLSGYAWALQQLGESRQLKILDAACGTGFGTYELAQGALRAVGVDLSKEAVSGSRARFRAPNLAYLVMDVTRLAFPGRMFDAIISQDTLEHVQQDELFIAEVARVLRPGGTFVVFTPCRESHTTAPENPFHIREYSPESLTVLLRARFPTVRLFGRRLAPALTRVEGTLDEVRGYDPWGLRALVPQRLRHWLGNLWLRARGAKTLGQISVDDIEYIEGVPPGCTTLIAVCRTKA
jgi:SAM-dependent methyltransferase